MTLIEELGGKDYLQMVSGMRVRVYDSDTVILYSLKQSIDIVRVSFDNIITLYSFIITQYPLTTYIPFVDKRGRPRSFIVDKRVYNESLSKQIKRVVPEITFDFDPFDCINQ